MTRYAVLKLRFVFHGRSYYEGDEFEAAPNSLLRRAVRDGDLKPASAEASNASSAKASKPAAATKRKPKGDES